MTRGNRKKKGYQMSNRKKPDPCRKALEWLADERNTTIVEAIYWLGTVGARRASAEVFTENEWRRISRCWTLIQERVSEDVRDEVLRVVDGLRRRAREDLRNILRVGAAEPTERTKRKAEVKQ